MNTSPTGRVEGARSTHSFRLVDKPPPPCVPTGPSPRKARRISCSSCGVWSPGPQLAHVTVSKRAWHSVDHGSSGNDGGDGTLSTARHRSMAH